MASTHNYTWHKIADSLEELHFPPNGLREIEVSGKKICLALHNNILQACTSKCPHAGGTLTDGYLDTSGNIVCPVHRYKFNMQNGRNISGEGYYLKIYAAEIRADGIYIGIEHRFFL